MQISLFATRPHRTALAVLAAAALLTSGISAYPHVASADGQPSIAASGVTSISTEKASYLIGEAITVKYTLPGPGHMVIRDHQGGSVSTLRSGHTSTLNGTIMGTVTPPAGEECLTLEHTDAKGVKSSAKTCFDVLAKQPAPAPSKDAPPAQSQPQVPGAGLYTLRNKATDQLLDSNTERKVYPLAPNGGAFQKWMLEAGPDGAFFIRDLATSFYLDSNANGDVYTLGKNGGAFQQWTLVEGTDGYFGLKNRATGLFLVDSSGHINTGALKAGESLGPRAQWKLTSAQP